MNVRSTLRALAPWWLGAALLTAPPAAQARDDWQLWLEQRWSVRLAPSLAMAGKFDERFRDDMSDRYVQVASTWLSWKALPWLKLEPGYHYQWTELANGDGSIDNRVFLTLTPFWSWGRFSFEDRNRVTHHRINGVEDWRYRNRPKLSVALGRDWYEMKPYVADEVFYGGRAGEWNRNRVYLGVEKPLTEQLTADVYYLLESNKTGRDWNETQVLGVVVNLAL